MILKPLPLKINWAVFASRVNSLLALFVAGGMLESYVPKRVGIVLLIVQGVLNVFFPNVREPSGINRPVDSQSRSLTGNTLPAEDASQVQE